MEGTSQKPDPAEPAKLCFLDPVEPTRFLRGRLVSDRPAKNKTKTKKDQTTQKNKSDRPEKTNQTDQKQKIRQTRKKTVVYDKIKKNTNKKKKR